MEGTSPMGKDVIFDGDDDGFRCAHPILQTDIYGDVGDGESHNINKLLIDDRFRHLWRCRHLWRSIVGWVERSETHLSSGGEVTRGRCHLWEATSSMRRRLSLTMGFAALNPSYKTTSMVQLTIENAQTSMGCP